MIGFGDMSIQELSDATSLVRPDLAKLREYDEPFILRDREKAQLISELAEEHGLQIVKGGRFYHLIGKNDKGKAVEILIGLYRRHYGDIHTVGIGDSQNDATILSIVDTPVLVRKPGGGYEELEIQGLVRTDGIGPEGWREAVLSILSSTN